MKGVIGVLCAGFLVFVLYLVVQHDSETAQPLADNTGIQQEKVINIATPNSFTVDPSDISDVRAEKHRVAEDQLDSPLQQVLTAQIPSNEQLQEFVSYNPKFKELIFERLSWLRSLQQGGIEQLERELGEMSPRSMLLSLHFAVLSENPELLQDSGQKLYSMLGSYEGKVQLADMLSFDFAELGEWDQALRWRYVALRDRANRLNWEVDATFLAEDAVTAILAMESSPEQQDFFGIEEELLDSVEMLDSDVEGLRASLPAGVSGISLEQVEFTSQLSELTDEPMWWEKET